MSDGTVNDGAVNDAAVNEGPVNEGPASGSPVTQPPVTVYWRPGCGFCSYLEMRMKGSEIDYERVNIWDDPSAAAFVRSVARGNETVPTVTVGDHAMVNPSIADIREAIATTTV